MKCLFIFLTVAATVLINLFLPAPDLTDRGMPEGVFACPPTDTLCPARHLDPPETIPCANLGAALNYAISLVNKI